MYGQGTILSQVLGEQSGQILVYGRGGGELEEEKENIFNIIL